MTLVQYLGIPCRKVKKSILMQTVVTREKFLQEASFYNALSAAKPGDRLVLVRMPKELCAADLDGQILKGVEEGEGDGEDRMLGSFSTKPKSHNKNRNSSSASSTNYVVKSSRKSLRVNSFGLTQPVTTAGLSSEQKMRLGGRVFDEFWSVNLGVPVEDTPMKKISKIVKRRAEAPLVEQPKNLRMRLLPFSTPSSKNFKK